MSKLQKMPDLSPIEQMIDRMNANAVFGTPVHEQGRTVIPIAALNLGFGFGGSAGTQGAVGGGAGGKAEPWGFVVIMPDKVLFTPIVNGTLVAIVAIQMVAWSVFWVAYTIRAIFRDDDDDDDDDDD